MKRLEIKRLSAKVTNLSYDWLKLSLNSKHFISSLFLGNAYNIIAQKIKPLTLLSIQYYNQPLIFHLVTTLYTIIFTYTAHFLVRLILIGQKMKFSFLLSHTENHTEMTRLLPQATSGNNDKQLRHQQIFFKYYFTIQQQQWQEKSVCRQLCLPTYQRGSNLVHHT